MLRQVRPVLRYAISFADGAMIFVVVEVLIPESQMGKHKNCATLGLLAGFIIMMIHDLALSKVMLLILSGLTVK